MNRSCCLSSAACRTRSSPGDTPARSCARSVPARPAFPSAPSLRSAGSAGARAPLFAGFPATMEGSDFSRPCIIGYGSAPSRCGPGALAGLWPGERSPGSRARSVRTCQGLRPRGIGPALALTRRPCCLPQRRRRRHPGLLFRGSMAGLCVPLSTLRDRPRGPFAHDSGPVWLATPSLYETSTRYSLPVSRRCPSLRSSQ